MEEESDKRAGGRRAPARLHRQTSDQREKPEKGRRLWRDTVCPSAAAGYSVSHQQPLVCSPLIRSFAMAIKVFAENC